MGVTLVHKVILLCLPQGIEKQHNFRGHVEQIQMCQPGLQGFRAMENHLKGRPAVGTGQQGVFQLPVLCPLSGGLPWM